ncbi:hypothetical protein RB195_013427 [Necator americanus]|uniref:Uncharacterized protein n=1 Tax=Necator americanus TaxID=51031 RepID=A0ABR1DVV1_NECAM
MDNQSAQNVREKRDCLAWLRRPIEDYLVHGIYREARDVDTNATVIEAVHKLCKISIRDVSRNCVLKSLA